MFIAAADGAGVNFDHHIMGIGRRKKQKDTFEDDGRTIVDMSGVTGKTLWGIVPRGSQGFNTERGGIPFRNGAERGSSPDSGADPCKTPHSGLDAYTDAAETEYAFERRKAAKDRPWEKNELSKEDRRAYFLGAMKAVFVIGSVYVIIFGIVIYLMCRL